MIKTIHLLILSVLLLTNTSLSAKKIKGNKNIIKHEIKVKDFNEIEVSSDIKVIVNFTEQFSATFEVEENLLDYYSIESNGITLKAKRVSNTSIHTSSSPILYLNVPALTKVELSGATSCKFKNELKQKYLDIDLSGASSFVGKLLTEHLDIDMSGASSADIEGKITNGDFDMSGAGRLEASEIDNLNIDLSGASNARVAVLKNVNIDCSGASNLRLTGDCKIGKYDLSGVASCKRIKGKNK